MEPAARRTSKDDANLSAATQEKCTEIEGTLRRLRVLRDANNGPGRLEIKTTKYPLGYGIHAINPDASDGVLYVKLYPYHAEALHKPRFILRKGRDRWYDSFARELRSLWEYGIIDPRLSNA